MFCSKCGAEVANGERFCPSCGNPAGAAAPAPRANTGNAVGAYLNKLKANVKNLGVNTTMYVGFLLTLVLSWMFVNAPIFASQMESGDSTISYSYGFTQICGFFGMTADNGLECGWVSVMSAIICVLVNLALIAAIVFVVLPIFMGKKVGPAVTLIGLITSASSLFLVILNYIFVTAGFGTEYSGWGGSKVKAFGEVFAWPSVAGWWYMLIACGSILLAVFLLTGNKKRR